MRAPHRRAASALVIPVLLVVGVLAGCASDSDGAAPSSTTAAAPGPSKQAEALAGRLDSVAKADVSGPVTGGTYDVPYLGMPEAWFDEYGYTEEEYFLTGEASAYSADGTLSTDGKWKVAATDETAPYTTRVVVRRPKDAADFNGTLVVEWLNVSAGRDSDPDFGFLADVLLSDGYAYASVSAQKMGVE